MSDNKKTDPEQKIQSEKGKLFNSRIRSEIGILYTNVLELESEVTALRSENVRLNTENEILKNHNKDGDTNETA